MNSFDWRVSIATIASDGPFSAFEGVDRVITLLQGAGVHLASDDGTIDHPLDTPLQPFAFPGEALVHGRLLSGECEDFNVMTRRATCRADVRVLRQAGEISAAQGLLLATHGVWNVQAEGQAPEALPMGLGLWWNHGTSVLWRLQPRTPDATLLVVTIHPQMATTR